MGNLSKSFALLLTLTIALSCLSLFAVKPAAAQISKPSVPEFTVKYVDYSYDIPPEYGVDQYNGQTIVIRQGEHVDNRTVVITIKNQPFTPYSDLNGNTINRFYDVRYKGSYTQNWSTMFANHTSGGTVYDSPDPYAGYGYAVQDYSSRYTTIIYQLTWQVPAEGSMDFQVEALEGYTFVSFYEGFGFHSIIGYSFYGQESGWSDTQTVKLGESASSDFGGTPTPSSTPTEAPTNTPTMEPSHAPLGVNDSSNQSSLIALSIGIVGVAILVAAVLIFRRSAQANKAASNELPPPPPP